tara:strand:- start:752 stop:955 length:204 start_codon:yes stop_codon:yes gene_type:complete
MLSALMAVSMRAKMVNASGQFATLEVLCGGIKQSESLLFVFGVLGLRDLRAGRFVLTIVIGRELIIG